MATILKCPRCQQAMDVTSVSPGSTLRCPDCGQMATVPTGGTNVAVKSVSAPIPASPPPAARDRGTRVRERRSSGTTALPPPQKPSHGGLFLGLGLGALAVAVVVLLYALKNQGEAPAAHPAPVPAREPVIFRPNLPPSSEKPIRLGEAKPEDSKPVAIARPSENVENANWGQLMTQLRPGGGFEFQDRPEGIAFQKVKSFGKAAYPKLIRYIDDEEPAIAIAAVAVLNALTGRDSPLPKGANKAKIKAEWEEWLKNADSAKPEDPKQR